MELKTNYQYTYFIHPFVIKESKYSKYIQKMLKDKNCKLKIFEKEKDFRTYKYFLPKTRDFLFSSFSFDNNRIKKLKELPIETMAAILCKYSCNIFGYTLRNDIQGKVDGNKGIFFSIKKIDVICFNTGICFLVLKTTIEDYKNFDNVLNFNYKFRDITQETSNLNFYDNIRLQTNSFETIETFREFIKNITGSSIESIKHDIDTERFLTYSYVCIDQEFWNSGYEFDRVSNQFIKFANILPVDNSRNFNEEKMLTMSKWKYARLGLSKIGCMLFSSSSDMNNYTILPDEFENQYFYTYVLNLYKKIYLKKLQLKFKESKNIKKARKEFIDFTKNMWIQEITDDETGTIINHKMQETFELEELYIKTKNKFDIVYKDLNIEKNRKSTIIIAIILITSLIFNILNFIALLKK